MINIRPVTDLRNKFSEIEEKVAEGEWDNGCLKY